MSKDDTHHRVWAGLSGLRQQLSGLVDKDPEQDVRGIAIPVVDALVGEAKLFLGDDPVVGPRRGCAVRRSFRRVRTRSRPAPRRPHPGGPSR